MKKRLWITGLVLLLCCLLFLAVPAACADSTDKKPSEIRKTDGIRYPILLYDEASLLTPEEEEKLLEEMRPLSEYCAVAFWSTRRRDGSVGTQSMEFCTENISSSRDYPCLLFTVNMSGRMIWLTSRGTVRKYVGDYETNTIPDKVKGYATDWNFYGCAAAAWQACMDCIRGNRVLSPVRIVCEVLIALAAALLAAFKLLRRLSLIRLPAPDKMTDLVDSVATASCEQVSEKLKTQHVTKIQKKSTSCSACSSCSSCSSGSSCSSCSSGSSCSSCSSGSSCSSCGSGGGAGF